MRTCLSDKVTHKVEPKVVTHSNQGMEYIEIMAKAMTLTHVETFDP